jgi:hypothetical protein
MRDYTVTVTIEMTAENDDELAHAVTRALRSVDDAEGVGDVTWEFEDHGSTAWRFAVGDRVRLTADDVTAPIYDHTDPEVLTQLATEGAVPRGAVGEVIQIVGDDQEAHDSEMICDMRWTDDGKPRSAIIYLGGDSCLEAACPAGDACPGNCQPEHMCPGSTGRC